MALQYRPPIPILTYHQTGSLPARGTPFRELVLPPPRFARQMRALHRLGWRGLSMRDLEPYLRGEKTGRVFGITMDDGYANTFEHALVVLQELGFTATSYVVSRRIGGSNDWDAGTGVAARPLMDAGQLRDWLAAGMDVGAHTRNHVNLRHCAPGRAREEISVCREELQDLLGAPVQSFCYPYGSLRAEHVEMAREAGYATATTSITARAAWNADLLNLPRFTIELGTPLPALLARVTTGWDEWRRLRWLRRLLAGARGGWTPAAEGGGRKQPLA